MGNLFSEQEKTLIPLFEKGQAYIKRGSVAESNFCCIFKYHGIFYCYENGLEKIGTEIDTKWRRKMLACIFEGNIHTTGIEKILDEMVARSKQGEMKGKIFFISEEEVYLKEKDGWEKLTFRESPVLNEIFLNLEREDYIKLIDEDWGELKKFGCSHPKIKNFTYNIPYEIDIDGIEKEIKIKFFEEEVPDWDQKCYFFSEELIIFGGKEKNPDMVREELLNNIKKTNYEIPYRKLDRKEWKNLKKLGYSKKDIVW